MFSLNSIHFRSIIWADVKVIPRLEKIISPNKGCTSLELLCSITTKKESVSSQTFFCHLTESEHVQLYKLILDEVLRETSLREYTISLNTPIQVIRNFEKLLPIFLNHTEQKIALELLESDIQALGAYEYGMLEKISQLPSVFLWLDDFGNNQSNFDILLSKRVDFNTVKVSKELFWQLINLDRGFLQSLLSFLSKSYNVIVEGVETKEQLDFLTVIKGVRVQGFYFNPQRVTANG